jgi:hypothetical protein
MFCKDMLKTTTALILALSYSSLCLAQRDSINDSSSRRINLNLSYNSSLIYPGISAGIEFPLYHINIQVIKNQKIVKYYSRGKFITCTLNWYHHPEFHDNLYLTAEWLMRRTKYSGFITEFSAGPGFSRTFLGGTTYRVDDNGNVTVVKLAGYNYALITFGGGLGYDFSMTKHLPFSAIAKMNIISMFPYNSTIYFRPVLEIGIRYFPGLSIDKSRKESGTMSDQK